jgi:hypothetical protein
MEEEGRMALTDLVHVEIDQGRDATTGDLVTFLRTIEASGRRDIVWQGTSHRSALKAARDLGDVPVVDWITNRRQ